MDYLYNVLGGYDPINMTYNYYPSEGLTYYNGTNWTTFNHSNSPLPDTLLIDVIKVDHYNNTWLSTNKGLIKYDGTNWTIYNTLRTLPYLIFGAYALFQLINLVTNGLAQI